jgi:hypothetical protein
MSEILLLASFSSHRQQDSRPSPDYFTQRCPSREGLYVFAREPVEKNPSSLGWLPVSTGNQSSAYP